MQFPMILRFLPALAFLTVAVSASAQTVINSVPYTITASGKYVLGNNLITASAAQTAITINAPNVILDLNQFFVSGPGGTPGTNAAVIQVGNVSNVTIRNGTVANNAYGILFSGTLPNSINHRVENVNATRCYVSGIYVPNPTSGTVLRQNSVSQTGGAITPGGDAMDAYAIYCNGGVRVEANSITDVASPGAFLVSGIDAAPDAFIIGNTISKSGGFGVRFGKCQNNLTNACMTPFNSTINGGGNF